MEVSLPTRPSSGCKSDSPQEQGAGVLDSQESGSLTGTNTQEGSGTPHPNTRIWCPRYQPNHGWGQAQPPRPTGSVKDKYTTQNHRLHLRDMSNASSTAIALRTQQA